MKSALFKYLENVDTRKEPEDFATGKNIKHHNYKYIARKLMLNLGMILIFITGLITYRLLALANNLEKQGIGINLSLPISKGFIKEKNPVLIDGIYLYGETSEPEQIGKGYIVFEIKSDKVIGAAYMPKSEFNCFYGIVKNTVINMTIIDSFEGTTHPYSVELRKFYAIRNISNNDQRILMICRDKYGKEGK